MRRRLISPCMLVFVRDWRSSEVLPGVADALGGEATRQIYKKLAETSWGNLMDPRYERWLMAHPAEAVDSVAEWLPGADQVFPLPPLGRGDRLDWGFRHAFSKGMPWVAGVRMECPEINSRHFREVGRALQESDLALVPTQRGSYGMIAMKEHYPEIFEGVPWGTREVFQATMDIALDMELSVYCLPEVKEVAVVDDLVKLGWQLPGQSCGP